MIALGKWSFTINTFFYSGCCTVEIFDNNGQYDFNLIEPVLKNTPEIKLISAKEVGSNIDAAISIPSARLNNIPLHAEINGDKLRGFITLPFLGDIPIKDGKKV